MEQKIYLALVHSLGITQKKLCLIFGENLKKQEPDYKNFYENLSHEIMKKYAIREKERENILKRKSTISYSFIKKKLEERSVDIITIKEAEYPDSLRQINNTPFLLYVRGKIGNTQKIAVVGSRKISSYGTKAIEHVVPELSRYFSIVSGGAYGCDTTAHKSTLTAGNITLSVIGTSICEDYPTGNKKMYDEIVHSGGAIISIFPIGVPGNAYNFPIRNEIVAALSVGVLVIEAKQKSGSLITSQLALDLGKDVFAIPGEIFKQNSEGCNTLIQKGEAKLVVSAIDILEEYNFSISDSQESQRKEKISFDDPADERIYNSLLLEPYTIDQISKKLKLDISVVSFKISLLEIKGLLKKNIGGKYELR